MSMFVNFSVMPLRISTLAGLVLSVLGAIGGAMAMAEALFSSPPPGFDGGSGYGGMSGRLGGHLQRVR
jgi:hypothetical protein